MANLLARLRNSPKLTGMLAAFIAAYVRMSFRTTKWERIGFEGLHQTLAGGEPVIIICWHQRLVYAPVSWDHSKGKAATLRSASHAGRVSGQVQERLGMIPVPMADDGSNVAGSLKIAKLMKSGVTLGITADGPEGPNRIFNGAALEWARMTGKPVYLFAFATKGYWKLKSWDQMHVPRPFTRGAMIYEKWETRVPRRPKEGEMEALRKKLQSDLNDLTSRVDEIVAQS